MWSFSIYKDKRYWILLITAIIILFLFAVFTPDYILEKTYVVPFSMPIFIVLFWSTYHLWKYFGDKKKRNNTDDSCDL
ncbi:permease [Psychrobacillus psychrodurans]|uniref:permease n=1 Tax=Psychrobacillus psychrodurans TaxID=126157 RepID=UPI003CFC14A2